MTIYKIYPQGFASNCYLLTADGKNAVAVDPAQPRILEEAQRRGLCVRYVLLTHGHFDHIGGCAALKAAGAEVGCLAEEKNLALYNNLGEEFGGFTVPSFSVDFTFQDGELLFLCGIKIKVIATPGHTAGSCCFVAENALFTGDTLFAGDVGRCDLPTGSRAALTASLKKLAALEGDYAIHAGHGKDSTLSHEKEFSACLPLGGKGRKGGIMLTSTVKWLEPELMDVVRLFEGANELEITHECDLQGTQFTNVFRLGTREYGYNHSDVYLTDMERKSLIKRYAKLSLYNLLSEFFGKKLPWGSLTGIRPTRLAYAQLEKTGEFQNFFRELGVLEENTQIVSRVLEGQKGIYERKAENCDLFVSLPFCPTKCVYCSFITAPIAKTRQFVPAYLAALEKELKAAKPLIKNLRSVYIGGGTPFALEPEELEQVFRAISSLRENGCEYTVEAGRPDVFSEEKLDLCRKYGVTRVCINAQSFSNKTLEAIGRKHTAEDVIRAFEMAKPYGFDVNCDLIAGLTDESLEEFKGSVDTAISLAPANITVHTLCLKKGAKLKEDTAALAENNLSEMIAYSREKLTAAGYEPYYLYRQKYMAGAHENVGWTKPHKACVYNVDVMEEIADNLAVGSNAITKKLYLSENRIERCGSPKDIPTYLEKVDKLIEEKEKLFK